MPYRLNSYLLSDLQNADGSVTMNRDLLNIKMNNAAVLLNLKTLVMVFACIALNVHQPIIAPTATIAIVIQSHVRLFLLVFSINLLRIDKH